VDSGDSNDAVDSGDSNDTSTDVNEFFESHEDATEEEMFTAWPWLRAEAGDCGPYMQSVGCGWTHQWNCPDQSGGLGKARVDGTLGYGCCCARGYWKSPPPTNSSGDYWSTGDSKTITVYHQSSPQVCDLIMASSFRLGSGGLCGKGIYFALTPQATRTKAITKGSHGGCMMELTVEVGKQGYFAASDRRPNRKYKESCGSWNSMNADILHAKGYDSVLMNRADGDEVIIFEPERVKSKRVLPFECSWMCKGACQKHWPQHCRR
jgi:hypothetical protein